MPAWSISEDSWTFAFPWPVSYPRAKYDDPGVFYISISAALIIVLTRVQII